MEYRGGVFLGKGVEKIQVNILHTGAFLFSRSADCGNKGRFMNRFPFYYQTILEYTVGG